MAQHIPRVPQPRDKRYVQSADGTRICYSVYGEGDETLVLSPGLATPPNAYDCIVERFSRRLRIITFDMRGTYRSATPRNGADGLRVEDSVDDLTAVVEQEGVQRFLLGGWSMGVQISLEYCHRFPDRCDGLLLINGPFGNYFRHTRFPFFDLYAPFFLRKLRSVGGMFGAANRLLLPRKGTVRLFSAARLISEASPFFLEILRPWSELDFRRYFSMMLKLEEHTAESYLTEIAIPTVITAGGRDIMTPVSTAELMARRIPDAELMVCTRGTHYTPIEFPDFINDAIELLLSRTYQSLHCGNVAVE